MAESRRALCRRQSIAAREFLDTLARELFPKPEISILNIGLIHELLEGKVPDEIAARTEPSGLSPVPGGLLSLLTQDEVLDLLAYLVAGSRAEPTVRAQGQ